MDVKGLVQSIADRVQTDAAGKTIYGEPVVAGDKTIIPVAKLYYGFGGGGGTQTSDSASANGDHAPYAEGAGGGGGVAVTPVGMIEITPDGTRYVSFEERRMVIRGILTASLIGLFLLRKRLRG